ncbi:MAG: MFS transporter [Bdellovibrio sp.]|nr:MAG: MFS transporter [Bdellovibrio sp.]
MYNRAEAVHQQFIKKVKNLSFPEPQQPLPRLSEIPLSSHEWEDLFETQITSRLLDIEARRLKEKGLSFYTISSAGHEGNAVFGKIFKKTDMAFLHYRSGAFFIQRAKKDPSIPYIEDILYSLMASSKDPIAGGRHKVWGSKKLFIPPQTSTIASHLPKAVGTALSISRAKDLKHPHPILPPQSVVLCSFGDASFNHSTAQGAINLASLLTFQHIPLPLVFICEDNQIGISVPTPKNWIHDSLQNRPGLKYFSANGLYLEDLALKTIEVEKFVREKRRPVFLHMQTVRLLGHAGSDVETTYHSLSEIEKTEAQDPLLHSARLLIENQILSSEEVLKLYLDTEKKIKKTIESITPAPHLEDIQTIQSTIDLCVAPRTSPPIPPNQQRETTFGKEFRKLEEPQHMAKLLNWALTDILLQYPEALIFGEDVAKKGGVYHVTDQLYKRFGVKRVFNSPLDEQSILGTAIGLAHNGFLPIPEIQFLAYVHNAEDQIRGEAATLKFFSQGQFSNPMVVRIAGLAYQKGFGGHFHNDNSLAIFQDIPGLIVAVPSQGDEAVKMLRSCVKKAYEEGLVCIFIEPIALYMTKDLYTPGDKIWTFSYPKPDEFIPVGSIGVEGSVKPQLTLVSYGNGYYYCKQAAQEMEKEGVNIKLINLRWIQPLPITSLLKELPENSPVLFVDECRQTGCVSETLIARIIEKKGAQAPPLHLLAAADCFIPLGPGAVAGLPQKESILRKSKEVLSKSKDL